MAGTPNVAATAGSTAHLREAQRADDQRVRRAAIGALGGTMLVSFVMTCTVPETVDRDLNDPAHAV
jgi:hypothetical protein